jgi:2-methylcitrate synthase/citrate synthase II
MTEIHKGLAGVVVDETKISTINVEEATLSYRGYPVQELAKECRFEEVAYLLWHGELPDQTQLAKLQKAERDARDLSPELIDILKKMPKTAHPMDVLRTAISFMGAQDSDWENSTPEGLFEKSVKMMAQIPSVIAAEHRIRNGQDLIAPRDDLSMAENFFHMYFDEIPSAEVVKAFDSSLTFYAEHSFNASTFTARTIVSSLSDIYSGVTGAIGSLKGPLHGGANEAVMDVFLQIESPDKAEAWLRDAIAKKNLVMGFGHRVYKNGDSRVPYMTEVFKDISEQLDGQKWVEIAEILENIMVKEKGIYPNLDFPVGPIYYMMGFDIPSFTPIFVMSRITGWTAHIMEQLSSNKLVRPLSEYTGPEQRSVKPLLERAA